MLWGCLAHVVSFDLYSNPQVTQLLIPPQGDAGPGPCQGQARREAEQG